MTTRQLLVTAVLVFCLACGEVALPRPTDPPTPTPPPTDLPPTATPTAGPPAYIPPQCEGQPVATLPAATTVAGPTPEFTENRDLTAAEQLAVLNGISNSVSDLYLYPDFNGHDWTGIVEGYRAQVEGGLETDAFYKLMDKLIDELGDDHSYFQSPAEIAAEKAGVAGVNNYVGIGVFALPLADKGYATVLAVLPGSPAEQVGLKSHDNVLAIDSLPIVENGASHPGYFRGPECSAVIMTVQTPGQPPRDIAVLRARIVAPLPVDARLVPTTDGSTIGYIFIPTFLDDTIPDQVAKALQDFGPLDGLIVDNRVNGGGSGNITTAILGYFTSGAAGNFVSRTEHRPLTVDGQSINGSQDVPLVVLVGKDTESYAEVFSGILQDLGRAKVVGENSAGNVETLHRVDLPDGARVWLAAERFEPINSKTGWEGVGVKPDVEVIAGWDTFTFENDPALTAALELLGHP